MSLQMPGQQAIVSPAFYNPNLPIIQHPQPLAYPPPPPPPPLSHHHPQFHQVQLVQNQMPPNLCHSHPPSHVHPHHYHQQQQSQQQQIPQHIIIQHQQQPQHQQQEQQQLQPSYPSHLVSSHIIPSPHPQSPAASDPKLILNTEKNPKKTTKASNSKLKQHKKVSAFVSKLYSMLHDEKLDKLIWWSRTDQDDYSTFAFLPGTEFATCLTTYFKHGNVASFVRQLHMYGFHKICENNNTLNDQTNHSIWEFKHINGKFKKNDKDNLSLIKRRANSRRNSGNDQYVSSDAVTSTSNLNTDHNDANDANDTNNTSRNNSVESGKHVYYPVYYTDNENDGDNKKAILPLPLPLTAPPAVQQPQPQTQPPTIVPKSDENGVEPMFRVPTPKHLRDPFNKIQRQSDPQTPPKSLIQSQSQTQLPPLTGRISPVSYKQNVFFQGSRQRYPSVFIDPCAPAPNSVNSQGGATNIPERIRSPPLPLQLSSILNSPNSPNSPKNFKRNDSFLPPISSISSHSTGHTNSISSISTKSSLPNNTTTPNANTNKFYFSRNSTDSTFNNNGQPQLRPSIFDLHNSYHSTSLSSSVSAQNSIFSISSSRIGSSVSSILNDDTLNNRRLPSLNASGNGSGLNDLSIPTSRSSLKTVVSIAHDSNSNSNVQSDQNSGNTSRASPIQNGRKN